MCEEEPDEATRIYEKYLFNINKIKAKTMNSTKAEAPPNVIPTMKNLGNSRHKSANAWRYIQVDLATVKRCLAIPPRNKKTTTEEYLYIFTCA